MKSLSYTALAFYATLLARAVSAADCTVGKPTGSNDTPQILDALKKCSSGGTVTIPEGEYQLLTPLSINTLDTVQINLKGKLSLPTSMKDQQAPGTRNWIWLEGSCVTISGGGTINGNGQEWYDSQVLDGRFALLGLTLKDSSISDITLEQPCNNFFNIRESSNVNFTGLTLTAKSSNENAPPHNTDGFDITDCDYLNFKDITIYNQDDCIAYKNGSSFITAENVYCNGGHGFSVGSLGKGGSCSVVSDITMKNMTCEGCWAVAQIKTYCAGSTGYVKNFLATDVKVKDVKIPIWVNTHYPCDFEEITSDGGCTDYPGPSQMKLSNFKFDGFTGTTNGAYDSNVAILDCPYENPCEEVYLRNIDVSPPSGDATFVCNNIDDSKDIGYCTITNGPIPKAP